MFPTNQPLNSTYDTGTPKIPKLPDMPSFGAGSAAAPAPTPAAPAPTPTPVSSPAPIESPMPETGAAGGGAGEKKNLLRKLVQAAMAQTTGKPLEEVIAGVKGAVAAFKNYAKEYDNIAKETQKSIGM